MTQPLKILMIGFGSIGQGLLPLLMNHISCHPYQGRDQYRAHDSDKYHDEPSDKIPYHNFLVHIITAHKKGLSIAKKYGASWQVKRLSAQNLDKSLSACQFDIIINVSVDVSSIALMQWCQKHDKLYLDTCIEPWAGGYHSPDIATTTNDHLRNQALHIKGKKTAVIAHGANPGLVSHFVKAALDQLKDFFHIKENNYPKLLHELGIRVIQVAEKDTQISSLPYPSTFVNTWSVEGFVYEACQRAEMGTCEQIEGAISSTWGAYLGTKGYETQVKSWVPSVGSHHAYLISHHEALSISEKFSYQGQRPTVYFAYKPCPQALSSWHFFHELDKSANADIDNSVQNISNDTHDTEERENQIATCVTKSNIKSTTKPNAKLNIKGNIKADAKIRHKIIGSDIVSGADELGVLFISEHFSYWFGSVLDSQQVTIAHNSATTQQVTISIWAALMWMIENPDEGIVEAEDISHSYILDIAKPYLGDYGGVLTDLKVDSLDFKDFLV